jgi:hypothetical protein
MALNPFRNQPRKQLTIHGQGATGRKGRGFRALEEHRAEDPQFVLKYTGGTIWQIGSQRVRTDELCQLFRLVRPSLQARPHFVEPNPKPTLGSLVGSLAPRQAAPDHN